ncbi:MAG: MFS transporter [Desulfobacteraceae bacterium]|nr:MFS transporter [Desulfobacteraceae bacterium]
MEPRSRFPRFHLFYGWYVLAASFLILFFNSGARFSIGVLFKPLISEFGWSRGSVSLAVFLNITVFALSLMIVGRFYDRYGPKWVIIISTLFLSTGYMSMSLIHSLWQFLIFYGVLAAVGLGGTSVPLIAALMSKWFEKRRGLAISLALSGSCFGQFVLVPVFSIFQLRYGWRTCYILIAVIMLVVNIALVLGVIKGNPDELGQKPFGYTNKEGATQPEKQIRRSEDLPDLGLREAMRTPSLWFFIIAMFICGSGDFMVSTHLIPCVTDHGISPTTAGNMLAWYGLMSLAGLIIAGPASDLIGNKIPIALAFVLRFFLFLMILRYQSLVSFYVFALFFGFTFLITAPLTTTLVGRLYGFSHVGILSGFIATIHHLGGGIWAYAGGVVFDETGSYKLAFILSAFMALAAILCTVLIKEKRHLIGREYGPG